MLYAVSSYNPETFFDKDVPIKFRQYTFFGEKSTIQTKSQVLLGILLIFLKTII